CHVGFFSLAMARDGRGEIPMNGVSRGNAGRPSAQRGDGKDGKKSCGRPLKEGDSGGRIRPPALVFSLVNGPAPAKRHAAEVSRISGFIAGAGEEPPFGTELLIRENTKNPSRFLELL